MRIPIGSRVELVGTPGTSRLQPGDTGTVVGYYDKDVYNVEWDKSFGGHNCSGLAKSGHGWNVLSKAVREIVCEDDADLAVDLSGLL